MAILRRAEATEDAPEENSFSKNSTIYIAGLSVVGALLLGVGIWLGIRVMRKRSQSKREKMQGAAFLSVRGLVREGEEKEPPSESIQDLHGTTHTFSRDQLSPSVVLPEKTLARPRPPRAAEDVLEYHRESGNFPRPFAPKPFSFALSAGGSSPASPRGSVISINRNSFLSSASSNSRFSVLSTSSSVDSTPTTGTGRKIRQVFNPILPDELLIKPNERLTVVQSFDDGWCLVGRESSMFASSPKSLFKPSPTAASEGSIELGVVPAWCFLKPVKGLTAERPVRSTSLGITVQMDAPGFSSRDEIISWSNF